MTKNVQRHPISNFFIMKGLQLRLIKKIVLSAILSTLVGLSTLVFVYYMKFDNTAFYPVSFDSAASIGERENILSIILPSVIISAFINILIAAAIGLYASRKYAVPIFKLEKWADLLNEGHMAAKLSFREKEEMKELSSKCNSLSENLRKKFENIQKETDKLSENDEFAKNDSIIKIKKILEDMAIDDKHINVSTSILKSDDIERSAKNVVE